MVSLETMKNKYEDVLDPIEDQEVMSQSNQSASLQLFYPPTPTALPPQPTTSSSPVQLICCHTEKDRTSIPLCPSQCNIDPSKA
ncbi:hypothetical protein J4Q44_G00218650 [Coregonus suidteri]|uniref:Uncharacterized protein n=1 Tax=Coregonus suidteri TaxID=861788 RepID=A0AAN8LFG1_9TELE